MTDEHVVIPDAEQQAAAARRANERSRPQPQRQDSLAAQMETVIRLATEAGCYDAADWIRRKWKLAGMAARHRDSAIDALGGRIDRNDPRNYCCEAAMLASPDPCPWHGTGARKGEK